MASLFPFRFIHCSDVHLGTGRQIHPERYLDFFAVFDEVVQAAIDERVDALFIAGDLFDTKEPDVETLSRAVSILKRLKDEHPKIQVLAIEGNHDMRKRAIGVYRNERGALDVLASADLLQILRPTDEDGNLDLSRGTFDVPHHGLTILGLGYEREDSAGRFNEAMTYAGEALRERRVIVLAHMMIVAQGTLYHGSARPRDLLDPPSNVIYVGLGHGHGRITSDHVNHRGVFYAPGSLEFVHIRNVNQPDETRGYFLSEVNAGGLRVEHRPTTRKRPFYRRVFNCDTQSDGDFDALRERVVAGFREIVTQDGKPPILSLEIRGRLGFPASEFRGSILQRDLREHFGALQVLVGRQELQTGDGETIDVEVMDDYTQALDAVLSELVAESAPQLGLAEGDVFVVERLREAISTPKRAKEEIELIRQHLAAGRPKTQLRELRLELHGQLPIELPDAIRNLVREEAAAGEGVRLTLGGQTPLDAEGLPVALDLAAIQAELAEEAPIVLEVSPALYGADALQITGGE